MKNIVTEALYRVKILPAFTACMVFMAGAVIAQEPDVPEERYKVRVVVTATKGEIPAREVASSVTVITAEQMEERQQTTVLEALRSVPGLDVARSGGTGGISSIFMRGANSNHTMVLIDGVSMNDPISTASAYDFAHMTTDNVARIEVLRGPQSALYGSDAIGGVINIITKKGNGKPNGFVSFEGGSYESFTEKGDVGGGNDKVYYSLGFSRQDSKGISRAAKKYGNTEPDGYGNTSVSGRVGITPAKDFGFDLTFRRIDSKMDLDNSNGDDINFVSDAKQNFFGAQGRVSLFDNFWDSKLGFSLGDTDRKTRNDTDPAHPLDSSHDAYKGRTYKIDWQNDFRLHKTNQLTFGLEWKKEQGDSYYYSDGAWGPYESVFPDKSADTTGYYWQDQIKLWDSWFTTVGVRLEDHSRFGKEATYHIASAYVFDRTRTKLKMSFGTGFKAPSLYQLYSQYGNEALNPEESTGWDAGVEQALANGKLTLGASYFNNDLEKMIDVLYDPSTWEGRYVNVASARTRGLEAFVDVRAMENLNIQGSYTFTDTKDLTTGLDLLRRARHKFGVNADWRFIENANLNVDIKYVGKRADVAYPAQIELDGYAMVNLAGSYNLTKSIRLFGRIENLFNKEYEEIKGYGSPGISAYGGVRLSF